MNLWSFSRVRQMMTSSIAVLPSRPGLLKAISLSNQAQAIPVYTHWVMLSDMRNRPITGG